MKNLFLIPVFLLACTSISFSQRAIYHQLDSIVEVSNDFGDWSTQSKDEYAYDSLGRLVFNNSYFYDTQINGVKPGMKSYYY